jgi:protein-S-isoprenylcysteine O-methyltransferase Ste14
MAILAIPAAFDPITLPWLLFLAYWAISAWNLEKIKQQEPVKSQVVRITILTTAFALLFSPWLRIGFLGHRFVPEISGLREAGILLAFAGVFVAIWARRHIGQYWSSKITLKVGHKLIQSGPYAYVRHPIYSGLALATLGTVLAIDEWRGVVTLLLLVVAHWRKAKREEAMLAQEFGNEFEQYRRHTGFLIPRFH